MTDERQLAAAFVAVALGGALGARDAPALAMVAASMVALVLGYRRRLTFTAAAAGVLLYYPLGLAFSRALPVGLGFLCAGLVLVPLAERLSFEYYRSSAMRGPQGVDREAERLAEELSGLHARRLAEYAGLASMVSIAAFGASLFRPVAPAVVAAGFALLAALWAYSRR